MSGRLPSSLVSLTVFFDGLAGVLVGDQHRGFHRHDLVVELAGLLARRGAQLALQRILVLRLAADLVARRHGVGGRDHGVIDARHVLLHPGIDQAVLVAARRALHQRDRLEAAGDHHRHLVDQHALGGHRDGLQARRAEAVDGHARDADRRAGAHRRDAGDVGAGRAFRRGAAQDHVLDLAELDLGALGGVLDRVRAQVGAVGVVEDAAECLADRRAGGGDDDGVSHVISSLKLVCLPLTLRGDLPRQGEPGRGAQT